MTFLNINLKFFFEIPIGYLATAVYLIGCQGDKSDDLSILDINNESEDDIDIYPYQ